MLNPKQGCKLYLCGTCPFRPKIAHFAPFCQKHAHFAPFRKNVPIPYFSCILVVPQNWPKRPTYQGRSDPSYKLTGTTQVETTRTPHDNCSKAPKPNMSLKRKSTCNTENSEIERKTLIMQLERQIREKDKTIKLLKQVNDSQPADLSYKLEKDKTSEQSQMQDSCKQGSKSGHCNSCDSTESRLRQMELNMFQNMTIMTNSNMQMATQMQTLSSQVMMQCQNMILQQQLLNVPTMNSYTHGLVHPPVYTPPFNHGFNMNQPQIFYQRPAYNPQVLFYRPVNTMNPQIYVPVQRPAHTQPPMHSQFHQHSGFVNQPSHVHVQQHYQQHPDVPRGTLASPAQSSAHAQDIGPQGSIQKGECQPNDTVVAEIQDQQSRGGPSPIEISTERIQARQDSDDTCNDSRTEDSMSHDMEFSHETDAQDCDRNGQTQSETEHKGSDHIQGETYEHESAGEKNELSSSSFLCIPGRKHIPPDNQELLIAEKSTKRQ